MARIWLQIQIEMQIQMQLVINDKFDQRMREGRESRKKERIIAINKRSKRRRPDSQ